MQRVLLLFLLTVGFHFFVTGQTGTIKGRVLNHKNNEPIPFTNIIIDGKPTLGTTSDPDGYFTLNNVEPGLWH